jgi:hypothetical protein
MVAGAVSRAKCEGQVVQFYPGQAYHQDMVARVIEFLQTRDPALFPFTATFDDERMAAFVRDLRDGLSDLTDSGSARKTAAAGFIMRDRRLHEIIDEWAMADGRWPAGSDPSDPVTTLIATKETR